MFNKIFSNTLKTKKSNYLPEVDGLRAIAVIIVLIFHLNPNGYFKGGFIGVDIFFVISGFLITGIIYEKLLRNEFSYLKFLEFRISRLYPALLFTITVTLIIGFLFYSPDYYQNVSNAGEYALFSIGNIFFAKDKGYWDLDSITNPFLHTWSLGVEQQFYLLWPLFIILAFKLSKSKLLILSVFSFSIFLIISKSQEFNYISEIINNNIYIIFSLFIALLFSNDKNKLIISITVISLLSLYSAEILSRTHQTQSFYLMPTRIFELGAGGAWYIYTKNNNFKKINISNNFKEIIFLVGIISLIYMAINYSGDMPSHPGIRTIPIVIASIFCIYGGTAKYSGIIIRNRFFVLIGLISYSIYLIHWPLIVYYKYITFSNEISPIAQISIFIISIVFGFFVYTLIENKYRRFSLSYTSKSLFIFLFVIIVIIAFSMITVNIKRDNATVVETYSAWSKKEFCTRAPKSEGAVWSCITGDLSASNKILVIGDSHAAQLIPFYNYIGSKNNIEFLVIAAPHCIPIEGFNIKGSSHPESCKKTIAYAKNIIPNYDRIIMNGLWEDGHTNNNYFKNLLSNFIINLDNEGKKLIFISAIPKLQSDPTYLKDSYLLRFFADIKTLKTPIDANKEFYKIISNFNNAKFLDLYNSPAFENIPFYNGDLMFFDHYHLNNYGSLIYAKYSEKDILNSIK
ncbi:acyltransferase family protein [Proteus mirabilis]|uniref:acyltransferase family protein n=1 Tax=Proteus mirabilis TaxID=584 RepID=UPI00234B1046|nr:acyltransferase family protein [Proteus mirabilis]MDC6123132.1 acyltransferase family protein [Proteus mirabilis]MDC6136851.1 acyltransferase family protein [Proteus mirabilis]